MKIEKSKQSRVEENCEKIIEQEDTEKVIQMKFSSALITP